MTNGMRLKWATITKGLGYSQALTERLYHQYLNHHKIIHWRDGFPVYSLSSPALFSKPMANFLSRTFYGMLQNRRFPNMMSFAVCDACDLQCGHCSFFEGVADQSREQLTLAECQKAIRDAQELGVSVVSFTGGEPLLREDLGHLIRSVDKSLATTLMFTNGNALKDRIRELKDAGLDSVYVSLDAAERDAHDAIRGVAGTYARAMSGIEAALRHGLSVGISTCIFPEGLSGNAVEQIVELGKDLGIHEILIFCAAPSGRLKSRQDLIDHHGWIEEVVARTEKYRDDPSYPGILAYNYNASHRSVGCSGGSRWFYLSPYGDISPCDFNHYVFGNLREKPLYRIWEEMSTTEPFAHSTWGGCKLRQSDYRLGPFSKYIQP